MMLKRTVFGILSALHITSPHAYVNDDGLEIIPVAIIGSGCSGLSAASVTAEYGYQTVIFCGPNLGGDLNVKTFIGNWPGFNHTTGSELMPQLMEKAKDRGAQLINETIVDVDFSQTPYKLYGESGKVYLAHKVLIATGTKEKILNVPGSDENKSQVLYNWDVHRDQNQFKRDCRNKSIAIIGGGEDASRKAILATMAGNAKVVHMFIRSQQLSLSPMRKAGLKKRDDTMHIHYHHEISYIEKVGDKLRLHFKEQALPTYDVDMLVVAIGRNPRTEMVGDQLLLDEKGYIVVNAKTQQTNIPGIFAAGDVTDACGPSPQAAIAAGNGMIAGYQIVEELIADGYTQQDFLFSAWQKVVMWTMSPLMKIF